MVVVVEDDPGWVVVVEGGDVVEVVVVVERSGTVGVSVAMPAARADTAASVTSSPTAAATTTRPLIPVSSPRPAPALRLPFARVQTGDPVLSRWVGHEQVGELHLATGERVDDVLRGLGGVDVFVSNVIAMRASYFTLATRAMWRLFTSATFSFSASRTNGCASFR